MKIMGSLCFVCTAISWLSIASGCTGYGKLAPQPGTAEKVTIRNLVENWNEYHIYSAVAVGTPPVAILFDPKTDHRTLEAEKWSPITDQAALSEAVQRVQAAVMYEILGPKGSFYGYMYLGRQYPYRIRAFMKVIGENTMHVYDLDVLDLSPP